MENVILFTDLNDPNFKPEENGGVDYEAGRSGGREGGREGWGRCVCVWRGEVSCFRNVAVRVFSADRAERGITF